MDILMRVNEEKRHGEKRMLSLIQEDWEKTQEKGRLGMEVAGRGNIVIPLAVISRCACSHVISRVICWVRKVYENDRVVSPKCTRKLARR